MKRVYKGLTVLLSVAISIGTAKDSGAVGASKANAAAAAKKFETFGIVCEARGHTVLTPLTQVATRDPEPHVVSLYSLVPPDCRETARVTGFSWANLDPSDLEVTKRGKRSTVIARIAGTVTGTAFRVTTLQTTDLDSVRFDGFSLARPAIIGSALVARSWPSSCNLSDSAVLSQQVPPTAQTLLAAALQEDPDLRVRTLLSGAREVVSYMSIRDSVRTLAETLGASVCIERDTEPLLVEQVRKYVRSNEIKAAVKAAVLPSGRLMILVAGDRISFRKKSQLMYDFGSRIVIDSAIRT